MVDYDFSIGGANIKNGRFNFVELRLDNDAKAADSELHLYRLANVTDLFVFIHGMNNNYADARSIYNQYFHEIAKLADRLQIPTHNIGVLGVFWPSMLSGPPHAAVPSATVITDDAVARRLKDYLAQHPTLRLHLVAHSLGTLVACSTLKHLGADRSRVRSVMLLQGAASSNKFVAEGEIATIADSLGGPIILTHSRQDLLMQGVNAAAQGALMPSTALNTLRDALQAISNIRNAASFGVIQGLIDAITWPFTKTLELIDGQTNLLGMLRKFDVNDPIGAKPVAGVQTQTLHRLYDDLWECGDGQYSFARPAGEAARGIFGLTADNIIPGHDDYKSEDVVFAHLVAAGLIPRRDSRRRADRFQASTAPTDRWMGAMWDVLRTRKLSNICLPGSHDAGTFVVNTLFPMDRPSQIVDSKFDSFPMKLVGAAVKPLVATMAGALRDIGGESLKRLTKTHDVDIYGQLCLGVRYLDLRITRFDNDYYLAHVTDNSTLAKYTAGLVKYIGGVGPRLEDCLDQIARFYKEDKARSRELLILNLSHGIDLQAQRDWTPGDYSALDDLLNRCIGPYMMRGEYSPAGPRLLVEETLEQHLSAGNIITLVPRRDGIKPERGVWTLDPSTDGTPNNWSNVQIFDQYANNPCWYNVAADQAGKFDRYQADRKNSANISRFHRSLFMLSWTATQQADPLAFMFGDILGNAVGMNRALVPAMDRWIEQGRIGPDRIPNIILMDFIGTERQVTRFVDVVMHINRL